MISRTQKVLTEEDIARIADTYHVGEQERVGSLFRPNSKVLTRVSTEKLSKALT